MATTSRTIQDYRNPALRGSMPPGNLGPQWITSRIVDASNYMDTLTMIPQPININALGCLLFSFPYAYTWYVDQVVCEVITAFNGSSTISIGSGTITTDLITTGGVVTMNSTTTEIVYMPTADITPATAALYAPLTTNSSAWLAAKAAASAAYPYTITGVNYYPGAVGTVPVVYAYIYSAGTVSVGKLRVHMLVTAMPALNAAVSPPDNF